MMRSLGILVQEWPLGLGVDVGGVVVKAGENAAPMFKVGDHVCGSTRLGYPGYNSGQEYVSISTQLLDLVLPFSTHGLEPIGLRCRESGGGFSLHS